MAKLFSVNSDFRKCPVEQLTTKDFYSDKILRKSEQGSASKRPQVTFMVLRSIAISQIIEELSFLSHIYAGSIYQDRWWKHD